MRSDVGKLSKQVIITIASYLLSNFCLIKSIKSKQLSTISRDNNKLVYVMKYLFKIKEISNSSSGIKYIQRNACKITQDKSGKKKKFISQYTDIRRYNLNLT